MSERDTFSFIVGGRAGAGVKKAGSVASNLFASMKRYVFQMDDYQSLIRGGHNFVATSTSLRPILSHYMRADLLVALDARSVRAHREDVREDAVLVYNSDEVEEGDLPDGVDAIGVAMKEAAKEYPNPELRLGLAGPTALAACIGLSRDDLAELIEREYKRDLEANQAFADAVYDAVSEKAGGRFELEEGDEERPMLTGNEAIALGACAAGLDVYFAYPMTPASTILHFLAKHGKKLGVTAMQPESEIAVANMAVGAAAVGARAMVGTSGGGFALMEEAFSLAGMAEVPFLGVLSSRPGPSTGVPTYTEQADLHFALHPGQGDIPRVVASPGTVEEAYILAAEMLALVWEFQAQGVLLTEKHLSESRVTAAIDLDSAAEVSPVMHEDGEYKRYVSAENGVSPLLFPPSEELINWTSYEHDESGFTTEEAGEIAAMHDKRNRKTEAMKERLKGMRAVNRHGDGGQVIFTYGSTTMSVLEALKARGLEATVVQPVYLKPFPVWELDEYSGANPIVVEQSSTGQFATLLRYELGVEPSKVITKYDGRPFEPDDLAAELEKAIG
ncbi:MAG: 2-oxoacid:acceptor oxidoreductase subunit alpha [Candidatus Eisenbacteria bacterium]|nr:2-oxoacid:acceptor oxidoreductase subunit alpha [Candidatus Eisenbacteria bacterium]